MGADDPFPIEISDVVVEPLLASYYVVMIMGVVCGAGSATSWRCRLQILWLVRRSFSRWCLSFAMLQLSVLILGERPSRRALELRHVAISGCQKSAPSKPYWYKYGEVDSG